MGYCHRSSKWNKQKNQIFFSWFLSLNRLDAIVLLCWEEFLPIWFTIWRSISVSTPLCPGEDLCFQNWNLQRNGIVTIYLSIVSMKMPFFMERWLNLYNIILYIYTELFMYNHFCSWVSRSVCHCNWFQLDVWFRKVG